MTQSAPKEQEQVRLRNEPCWERPTLEPQVQWERWRIILLLDILAKELISIDILREAPPDNFCLNKKKETKVSISIPFYKETTKGRIS